MAKPHSLIYFSVDGHLGRFHFLATMNNVVMDIHMQVFVWTQVSNSLGDIPRSGIPGSHGNSVFNLSGKRQTVSQGGCTVFTIPPAEQEGSNCSTSLPTLATIRLYNHSHPRRCAGARPMLSLN